MYWLDNYKSIVIDYSILREFGETRIYNELLDELISRNKAVYVSRAFKLLHFCVLHQADVKYSHSAETMKDFCTMLLQNNQLNLVQATSTEDFIGMMNDYEDCCILFTADSIFAKRLREKKPHFSGDLCIMSQDNFNFFHGIEDFCSNYPEKVISPLAAVNKYLDVPVYCNVGDAVQTDSGKTITLTKRISNGAEGMVFNTDNSRIVAKIYHKGVITPLRWSKLKKMVEMGINSVGICWPQNLLFYKGVPVGYTMLFGKGSTLGNVFDGPDAIVNKFPDWKRSDVVNTVVDLLEKYLYLHMHDIIVSDIQLKNSLIFSSSSLYLIDMDSVQVGNLPCPVGTEEFTDPALWGKNFSDFLRTLEDEDYCISMMVFSILFCGLHPYATRHGAETLREEIICKNFPYLPDNSDEEHIPLGGYNYIWQYLPDNLRDMLYRTFKMGQKFEAVSWYEACVEYRDNLAAHKYEDEEAYKVFPKMDYKPAPKPAEVPVQTAHNQFRNKFAINSPAVIRPTALGSDSSDNLASADAVNNDNSCSPFVPLGSGKSTSSSGSYGSSSAFGNGGGCRDGSGSNINRNTSGNSNTSDDGNNSSGIFGKLRRGLFR